MKDPASCIDCKRYRPDSINPVGGLGDCPIERPESLVEVIHKGEKQYHRQKKLIYPWTKACAEFASKTARDSNTGT